MAEKHLATFLTKFKRELETYDDFRKELDRQPQTFVFSKRTLFTETIKQLSKGHGMNFDESEKATIRGIVNTAGDKLIKQLKQIQPGLKSPGGKSTLIFDNNTDVPIPAYLREKKLEFLPFTAFRRVTFAYRNSMNEMFTELQNFIGSTGREKISNKDGSEKKSIMHFFDAGHQKDAGVFERFLDQKTQEIMAALDSKLEAESQISNAELVSFLKTECDIDLEVKKVDNQDMIIIRIESASQNRSDGQKLGLRSRDLKKKINAYLESKGDLENLEGSDSLKTRKIKKARNEVMDPFRKVPGAIVSEKAKIKNIKSSSVLSVGAKVRAKNTKLNTKVKVRKAAKQKQIAESPASTLLRMIAMINKKLPRVIRENMQQPALQNRTGRFADSVKVTEVVQTPKGYPSVGYTYRKNPYQVYEMGRGDERWATPERDPRKLIDRSIREIAAEMALGRLFTRRI